MKKSRFQLRLYDKAEKSVITQALSRGFDKPKFRFWVRDALGLMADIDIFNIAKDAGFIARLATMPSQALRDYMRFQEDADYISNFEHVYGLRGIKESNVMSELMFRKDENVVDIPSFSATYACYLEQKFSAKDGILNHQKTHITLANFWDRMRERYHLPNTNPPVAVCSLYQSWCQKNQEIQPVDSNPKTAQAIGFNGESVTLSEDDGYIGFYDVIIANSANIVKHDSFQQRKIRYDNIRRDSDELASRLEAVGVNAYIDGSEKFTKIGLLSGISQSCPQAFRHIIMLPSVTEQDRKQLINQISYWADNDFAEHAENLRYFVITCENVPFGGNLRKIHKRWMRRISSTFLELNEKFGIRIQLRTTDLTINESKRTVNLHANVLCHASKKITNREGGWRAVLNATRQLMRCRVHDAGRLETSEDCRKVAGYMCKAFDLRAVENGSLRWLADELIGLRIVQRYNDFKGFSKHMRNNRLRVVNHHKRGLVLMKKRRVDDSELFTVGSEDTIGEQQELAVNGFDILKSVSEHKENEFQPPEEENKFIGIELPHCAFMNVSEPVLLVRNYTTQPSTKIGRDALSHISTLQSRLRDMLKSKLCDTHIPALRDGNHQLMIELYRSGGSDITAVQNLENLSTSNLDKYTISHITTSSSLPVGVSKGGCQPPLVEISRPPGRPRWPYHRIKSTFKPVSQLTPQTAVETCAKSRVERPERRYPAPRIQRDPVASEQAPASLWHRVELPADGSCPF